MYDILLKNVRLIDPHNSIDKITDIACENGKIAEISEHISASSAHETFDFEGALAIPGIIDAHVHLGRMWGSPYGHRMLAKAGVTTCLDMAGPIDDVVGSVKEHGAGLNIATLQFASPPFTFKTDSPTDKEIDTLIDESLTYGAFGIKLLGGHYPLTPEISQKLILKAHNKGAYVAWHAGTTTNGSNILGMKEAVELADGNFLHLAHINSYCRGTVKKDIEETLDALKLLEDNPNIYSESYISPMNGTRLTCADGKPISKVTCGSLEKLGLPPTEQGITDGFMSGLVNAVVSLGNESVLVTGKEGLEAWLSAKTDIGGSFPVNPPIPRTALVSAKRKSGAFAVDCISTDGGCIPRNVILSHGLALVELDALSLPEFVTKCSWNPSRMLRLDNKGHLSINADADITVINKAERKAVCTIANGKVIMYKGLVTGRGGKIICTARGEKNIKNMGLETVIADPSHDPFGIEGR